LGREVPEKDGGHRGKLKVKTNHRKGNLAQGDFHSEGVRIRPQKGDKVEVERRGREQENPASTTWLKENVIHNLN